MGEVGGVNDWILLKGANQEDCEEVRQLLTGYHRRFGRAHHRVMELLGIDPAASSHPKFRTAIVENSYTDGDFMDSYYRFYARGYGRYPDTCKRIHVFNEPAEDEITKEDVLHLKLDQSKSYLGFVVVRPPGIPSIGRTVLNSRRLLGDELAGAWDLACCDWEAHLFGQKLNATGALFMEQDHGVAACASAATWIALNTVAHKFDMPACTTTKITELAGRIALTGRALPSEGLSVEQLLQAMLELQYDPVLFLPRTVADAQHIIYTAIESEIPPLLDLEDCTKKDERHVVAVVGHGKLQGPPNTYRLSVSTTGAEPGAAQARLQYSPGSQWASCFIAHCDQRGPYRQATLSWDGKRVVVDLEQGPAGSKEPPTFKSYLNAIIVPLPTGVALSPEHAQKKAAEWICTVANSLAPKYQCTVKLPPEVVLRSYLRQSKHFKNWLLNECPHLARRVKETCRLINLPRYIWVTEVIDQQDMGRSEPAPRLSGLVILDSYGTPHDDHVILVYLGNALVVNLQNGVRQFEEVPIEEQGEIFARPPLGTSP